MFMFVLMIVLFILGYTVIALEHPLKINKTATALLLGVILWVCAVIGGESILVNPDSLRDYVMTHQGSDFVDWLVHSQLIEALGEVSEILFFLLGAMTIVELVDTQGGFRIITDQIKTTKKVKLLWVISILTFFMSSVLDNLTTSIVMVALLRKLIEDKKDRWFYASMVIIAANSGGAWTPIGDVTTIMLWIAGKVTALNIMEMTFIASFVSLLVPLIVLSFILKGEVTRPQLRVDHTDATFETEKWQRILFLCMGVGALLFVPVFKALTHLPPYLGMLGGLGVIWVTSEIIHRKKSDKEKSKYAITTIITKIDMPSILFFLGILMAVNALATIGHLDLLSQKLEGIPLQEPQKYYVINVIIGLLSSVVDNVPLVAGAMGMYHFPTDHYFWEMLAYCAGTGGSILIIGSAAGVAVMGMEKIDFIWYLKKISWIALLGYFAGAAAFVGEKAVRQAFGSKSHENQVELKMTEDGINEYLSNNTFYVTQQDEEQQIKDSTTVSFIDYSDHGINYYGLNMRSHQTNMKLDTLFNYSVMQNLSRGKYSVDFANDTVAQVQRGDNMLLVTKSGKVYLMVQYGMPIELIKAD